MDAMCEHLEAQSKGQIRNLKINIPPGCTKSRIVSVFWTAWEWTWQPWQRWLCFSYHEALAYRDNIACRMLIKSDWYQSNWPILMVKDQDQKGLFQTEQLGHRLALSIGGSVTGWRGNRIVIDDPHNVTEVESDISRQAVIDWFKDALPSRINNPEVACKTIVMQRVHQMDLCGWIDENEKHKWESLVLPMEFETERATVTSLGFRDPRKEEGELLCPDRFPRWFVDEELKVTMTDTEYAGQYQQRPAPKGGSLFKEEWFRWWCWRGTNFVLNPGQPDETVYEMGRYLRMRFTTADTAATEKTHSDWSVFANWFFLKTGDLLLDKVDRQKLIVPKLPAVAQRMYSEHRSKFIAIENKSSGTGLGQELRLAKYGMTVVPMTPDTNKVDRSQAAQIRMKNGQVFWPLHGKAWIKAWVAEICDFNAAGTYRHDDQVDNLSMAGIIVSDRRYSSSGTAPATC